MSSTPTWGVVSTIKAPTKDILNFAAHHLDLGAHRVWIYLDAPDPAAFQALEAHPRCRVVNTDEAYWSRHKKRPDMHQPRQTLNATHCYKHEPDVDWLGHIDVDEFLWPSHSFTNQLSEIPSDVKSTRIRPVEALQNDPDDAPPPGTIWCKGFSVNAQTRRAETPRIYPTYGTHLNGGMLSHVVGKVFVRTGLNLSQFRIHNAFFDHEPDPNPLHLSEIKLVHLHAQTWEHWKDLYEFRLQKGSYRESLKATAGPKGEGLTMNALLSYLEETEGEAGLRALYEETCVATQGLRDRLKQHGHLHSVRLNLEDKRKRHFPDAA